MSTYRVWLPHAHRVELVDSCERHPLESQGDGWWGARFELAPGQRYRLSIDGGPPRADPRTMAQPDGPHGDSQWVDPSRFEWSDQGFEPEPWERAVMYELHVGTFTEKGTFDAAIERLDHLVDLGVTHVEVMPVADFPGARGWGYDGVHLFATVEIYGGPAGLVRFVDAAHRRGLAVVLDVVYNHLGPDGAVLEEMGYCNGERTPWGPALQLDGPPDAPVRRFVVDNALMWLRDYHFDGLRLDAVQCLIDRSELHILEQLSEEVARLGEEMGRTFVLVAETPLNDPHLLTARSEGGWGIDAQWNDDFHHAVHAWITSESYGYYRDYGGLEQVAHLLTHPYWFDGSRMSSYWGRVFGGSGDALDGTQFVTYVQNHDQVGNRPQGERLSALVGPERTKLAVALLLLSPHVPLLFQGEEWGSSSPFLFFVDHAAAGLPEAVEQGRRGEFRQFGWPSDETPSPQAAATFERCLLHWDEIDQPEHADMLRWYRELLAFRRTCPSLGAGRMARVQVDIDTAVPWLWLRRDTVEAVFNFSIHETVHRNVDPHGTLRLRSSPDARLTDTQLVVPPLSVAIVEHTHS